ncbi:rRNA-processing protein UTP23 homolog [Dendronephthya gigantea]|uniref:rRNA-processing protein UTP23 homolog n=1 Tax=Dendronephthya gigantea TaxID=151771 RepID=UPI00106A3F9A|nr:rRNA-processing protein UTP23 homolog [Dendronephthya gigantea]XP_028398337.1 rRNA-processing protein UTP23 homolog [Dendronephthya gigantea]XP_028398338.1 rRNA-processing protein UTP23 homolog [Dendronephthya gigantea]XP_028398339.1 rRNA-processing protein UTP23 homolog [Dendronephthya gigantea]
MKVKRQKTVKKYINLFKNSFGVFEPYQILIDGTFCQAALQNRINIKEQLPKYLDADIQLLTTECVLHELESLGGALYGALVIAKRFKTRKCSHREHVPATECVAHLVGDKNEKRYFVATQDKHLRNRFRKIPGVPLLYINYNCIVMEKPSFACTKKATEVERARTEPTEHERGILERLKTNDEPEIKKRKRKRAKGPNPLSCKRKKISQDGPIASNKSSSRKRRKNKIPAHVLEVLGQNS